MPFKHSQEDVTKALTALIFCGGSPTEAKKYLDFDITRETLSKWKGETYRDYYLELSEKFKAALEDGIAREMRELVAYTTMVERKAVEQVNEELDQGRLRGQYAAQAVAQLSKSKGENVSKLLTLTGRPAVITEHRSVDEIVRKLKGLGIEVEGVPVKELTA